jgi:hypothetical protein
MEQQNLEEKIEDRRVGINFATQMLRCLIVMNDEIGAAMSGNVGNAFFRAFVVEDRKTGEILMNQRFRYKDGDSWSRNTAWEGEPAPEPGGEDRASSGRDRGGDAAGHRDTGRRPPLRICRQRGRPAFLSA